MIRPMRALMITAAALCAVACTKRNPDYCESSAECTNGYECVDHGCEPIPDAAATCPERPCPAAMPVCQADGSCALCSDDAQCPSGVCNDDGSCEPETAVIHVSTDGATSGDCGAPGSPCSIEYARTKITADRHTLVLAGGDYALTESFHVGATIPALVLVGPPIASFTGPDTEPSILVTDDSQLDVRGISFRRGVACDEAGMTFRAVTFSDPLGAAIPWIAGTRCDIVVLDGQLLDSPTDAIALSPPISSSGSLRVERTTIARSAGAGIDANPTMTVVGSTIHDNAGLGIYCAGACTVARSFLFHNELGGLRCGGTLDITNNIIGRNGNDPASDFGGAWLQVSSDASRIEHNTIAFNDSDPDASPRYAGGMYCNRISSGSTATPNNLICNNFAGNTSMAWSQVAGNCNTAGSLVINDCPAGMFVAPFDDEVPDLHLASGESSAIGAATPSAIIDDYDGEPRDGDPDAGADELVP